LDGEDDVLTTPEQAVAALQSSGTIPRQQVIDWIASGDLETWGVLYVLTDKAYRRIEPELGMHDTCTFIEDYLVKCLIENPEAGDWIHSGYEAAWDLAGWVKHLERLGPEAMQFIREVAARVEAAFRVADAETRDRIVNGFLEHVFEKPSLRAFFASWENDPVLAEAYTFAAEWGNAHLA
jgi:hypothetical protein